MKIVIHLPRLIDFLFLLSVNALVLFPFVSLCCPSNSSSPWLLFSHSSSFSLFSFSKCYFPALFLNPWASHFVLFFSLLLPTLALFFFFFCCPFILVNDSGKASETEAQTRLNLTVSWFEKGLAFILVSGLL